jgi:hypothetical protein
MLMQDFLNNTFETTKFNSMDLEIWHHKLSVVTVVSIKRDATYFYITKIKVPSTKDNYHLILLYFKHEKLKFTQNRP